MVNPATSDSEATGRSAREMLLRALTETPTPFCCPDETLPITAAVHQARLRAHYPKCRECPHRDETGSLSDEEVNQLQLTWKSRGSAKPVHADGYRGILWNEFTLRDVSDIATGLCRQQWDARLNAGRTTADLTFVVGRDGSVNSLHAMEVALQAIREQGGELIDLGEVSGPCFQFAVEHLGADAGVHATAAGESENAMGLDLYTRPGIPLSAESLLAVVDWAHSSRLKRCSRRTSLMTQFPARQAYTGTLWKYFRNIPPGRVLVGCASEFVMRTLHTLAAEVSLSIVPLDPELARTLVEEPHRPSVTLQSLLQEQDCVLAAVIGDDGQACQFFRRSGDRMEAPDVVAAIWPLLSGTDHREPKLLVGEEWPADLTWPVPAPVEFRFRQSLREHFARGMLTAQAVLGIDFRHRYWLPGQQSPICDAIAILGLMLQAAAKQAELSVSAGDTAAG